MNDVTRGEFAGSSVAAIRRAVITAPSTLASFSSTAPRTVAASAPSGSGSRWPRDQFARAL